MFALHLSTFLHSYMQLVSSCGVLQGPCCTSSCELKFGDKCRDDNGCRDASFCDGRGPQCPPSINKPNKTICNEEFVCFMGVSMYSIHTSFDITMCWSKIGNILQIVHFSLKFYVYLIHMCILFWGQHIIFCQRCWLSSPNFIYP
jgi:hypothetical protein